MNPTNICDALNAVTYDAQRNTLLPTLLKGIKDTSAFNAQDFVTLCACFTYDEGRTAALTTMFNSNNGSSFNIALILEAFTYDSGRHNALRAMYKNLHTLTPMTLRNVFRTFTYDGARIAALRFLIDKIGALTPTDFVALIKEMTYSSNIAAIASLLVSKIGTKSETPDSNSSNTDSEHSEHKEHKTQKVTTQTTSVEELCKVIAGTIENPKHFTNVCKALNISDELVEAHKPTMTSSAAFTLNGSSIDVSGMKNGSIVIINGVSLKKDMQGNISVKNQTGCSTSSVFSGCNITITDFGVRVVGSNNLASLKASLQ